MKFIHIADSHLDAKFDNLIGRENLSQKRKKVIISIIIK